MVRGNADRPIYKHSFWEETFHTVAYPGILFGGEDYARNFFSGGCSTNSVEDRGQRGQGIGGVSPLARGSTQFENE
jgi:hypothetical protein